MPRKKSTVPAPPPDDSCQLVDFIRGGRIRVKPAVVPELLTLVRCLELKTEEALSTLEAPRGPFAGAIREGMAARLRNILTALGQLSDLLTGPMSRVDWLRAAAEIARLLRERDRPTPA